MMKVLVCGGRNFSKLGLAWRALDQLHAEYSFTLVIDGKASGADSIAHKWALHNNIPTEREPADWAKYGRSAGRIRNGLMITKYEPELIVAFPGGPGTDNMIKQATSAGIPVKRVVPSGSRT